MEFPRKLVSVRRISEVERIRGTFLVKLRIDGWQVVTGSKYGFDEGQLVVYFEIDSFLPDNTYFWEYCVSNPDTMDGEFGFRVQTLMEEKHISQGLVFSLDTFEEITEVFRNLKSQHGEEEAVKRLMDMSFEKELGVKKWQEPAGSTQQVLGPAPVFISQPGCMRAQNVHGLMRRFGPVPFQITEKLDGYPMTVYCVQKDSQWYSALPPLPEYLRQVGPVRVGIATRFAELMDNDDSWYWITAKAQGVLDKIQQLTEDVKNVAIQGELCGSTIFTNSMGFLPGEHHFYVFGIFDIDRQTNLLPQRTKSICHELALDHVPVLHDSLHLEDFATGMEDLIKKAEGEGLLHQPREGLVFKSTRGGIVFKVISNTWLLITGKQP